MKPDPEDNDIAFGLCDLGMGCPETGSVRISELEAERGRLGRSFRVRCVVDAVAPAVLCNAARSLVDITSFFGQGVRSLNR